MKLYLMQHALAYPAEENAERPLTPAGTEQAKASARGIKKLGLSFDLIITSSKRRAHQTAALVAESVRYPYSDILAAECALPNQAPHGLLDLLQKESDENQILVVGHMPHLAKVANKLMMGGEILFVNAGLSCFELSGPAPGSLVFHLTARQLEGLS